MVAQIRNVGADGQITVEVKAYRDQACTRLADDWSTVIYLKKGQEQTVTIRLANFQEGGQAWTKTSATPTAE